MGQQGEVKHGHSVSVACRKGYEQTSGEGGTTYTCSNGQLTGNHIVCQGTHEIYSFLFSLRISIVNETLVQTMYRVATVIYNGINQN